jgi:hypothetical protein
MTVKYKVLIFIALVWLASCTQIREMKNLLYCDFRLATIENVNMAGIDVQKIKSFTDLSFVDGAKLLAAVASGSLPLNFTLNVEAKNPNGEKAALNKLDWLLLIDDIQVAEGTTTQRVEIPPANGTGIFPLQIRTDLAKVLSGQSGKNVVNLGLNLVGYGNKPSRITLKAKPTIMIGNMAMQYPGYISIKNEFGSK